jgi:hypothetical protein
LNRKQHEQYSNKGYYDNAMYNYVKANIHSLINGEHDIGKLKQIVINKLRELGHELHWSEERINDNINNYGMKCFNYWAGKYNLRKE